MGVCLHRDIAFIWCHPKSNFWMMITQPPSAVTVGQRVHPGIPVHTARSLLLSLSSVLPQPAPPHCQKDEFLKLGNIELISQ